MQYSALVLAAFAATGSLAAPSGKPVPPNGLKITLNGNLEGTVNHFDGTVDRTFDLKWLNGQEINSVALAFGSDKVDVRCQLLDDATPTGKPVVMTRGANIDINFSKGDPWTFRKPAKLTQMSCGPSFLKTDQNTVKDVNVTLTPYEKHYDPTVLTFKEDHLPAEQDIYGEHKELFEQVTLGLGIGVEEATEALRCKAVDSYGEAIIVKRGENIDFTFGDGGKGPWTFIEGPAEVYKVICDPAFKKDDATEFLKNKKPADKKEGYETMDYTM